MQKIKPDIRTEIKGRFTVNDFQCGVVVSARQAGLSISETADLNGFLHTTISRV